MLEICESIIVHILLIDAFLTVILSIVIMYIKIRDWIEKKYRSKKYFPLSIKRIVR